MQAKLSFVILEKKSKKDVKQILLRECKNESGELDG
ncbi:hypothetical protein BJ095_12128 [Ureibacillus chungkukjangi]|uniref:Uncharacterized protein n=1 Tax=Ureibacillus chungkukjangi TaxID=1202712 RepID=A0A318TIL4_9BACL|nr:hypothetical protein BJ095_12128 [Ureibacillus chungkukjangi]